MEASHLVCTPPDRALRIAVVGCGEIAPLHLEAIAAHEDAILVGVADTNPDAAAAAGIRYGAPAHACLEALLAQAAPDVVHLCTPHDRHVAQALQCLDAGVHVLTEKPVATTVTDGTRLAAAARAGRAMAGVCLQNRYNTTSVAIRRFLDGGEAGRVLGGRAAVDWWRDPDYYRRRPWRGTWAQGGGGVLINQAIHTLDLLLWRRRGLREGHGNRLPIPDWRLL